MRTPVLVQATSQPSLGRRASRHQHLHKAQPWSLVQVRVHDHGSLQSACPVNRTVQPPCMIMLALPSSHGTPRHCTHPCSFPVHRC